MKNQRPRDRNSSRALSRQQGSERGEYPLGGQRQDAVKAMPDDGRIRVTQYRSATSDASCPQCGQPSLKTLAFHDGCATYCLQCGYRGLENKEDSSDSSNPMESM